MKVKLLKKLRAEARSTYGSLKMHFDEPRKFEKEGPDKKYGWWESEHYNVIRFIDPFPEVTFENSPMELELVIKK